MVNWTVAYLNEKETQSPGFLSTDINQLIPDQQRSRFSSLPSTVLQAVFVLTVRRLLKFYFTLGSASVPVLFDFSEDDFLYFIGISFLFSI